MAPASFAALLSLLAAAPACGLVNVATWASTAFAGARVDAQAPTVSLTLPPFSSARVTGTVAAAGARAALALFSVVLGGASAPREQSGLLWVDDHVVIDLAGRGATAFQNVSFAAGAAPLPFRLEWVNAANASATVALWWRPDNASAPAAVPASSLSAAVAPAEVSRQALRDRLAAPAWGWGTYHGPSMATHVLLPKPLW